MYTVDACVLLIHWLVLFALEKVCWNSNASHAQLAGIDLETFVNRLEQLGIHIQPLRDKYHCDEVTLRCSLGVGDVES